MSGGHWGYQQRQIDLMGSALEENQHPELRALGLHLDKIADLLDRIDRILSKDADAAQLPDLLAEARRLSQPMS